MRESSYALACSRDTTLDIVWVCRRYRVGKPLGSGSFGSSYYGHIVRDIQIHIGRVYLGKDIKTE